MPFIQEILGCKSISVVGLEKNTGKTECLNYILRRLPSSGLTVAVSSAGTDGERVDMVTGTSKPEIFLREGILFSTSEKYYRERRLTSEILSVSRKGTSTGRIVTARVLTGGKILLSGHPATEDLKKWIEDVSVSHGADLSIIDGALSRLSIASPAVTEGMVLATGAALSASMDTLVRKTAYTASLIAIPATEIRIDKRGDMPSKGLWRVENDGTMNALEHESSLTAGSILPEEVKGAEAIYASGAVTDRFLNQMQTLLVKEGIQLIVRDFTRIFASQGHFNSFIRSGGVIKVVNRSKLIAICANPVSPEGFILDSSKLCGLLGDATGLPVYDIMKSDYEA
ncbi:MAG: hypothetical protein CVT97_06360 [Bacteroidetes bacterium HGW-Bacteroidetes-14]|jgi:hypothetical protein|nr:MAG: hypothetical protein CVT97_06360 [Bacteroidetes bacterium HGW-Bacteroidetes-14]